MAHFLKEGLEHLEVAADSIVKSLRRRSHSAVEDADGGDDINDRLHDLSSTDELFTLLERDDINTNKLNSSGSAPLHSLAKRTFKKSLGLDLLYTFLTESDVDINLPDRSGNTALHLAAEKKDVEFAKMLIAFGADLNHLNKWKKTPLDSSLGKFAYLDRTESLVEIISIPSTSEMEYTKINLSKNLDELGTLLKDSGAMLGCQLQNSNVVPGRKVTQCFVDVTMNEWEKEAGETTAKEKVLNVGDDWCTKISKMHFRLETNVKATLKDVNKSLVFKDNVDQAAALGIQIREMRLLQMAGSRMLFLDGGGIRGLLEIDILCQIEKQTGRKITELFDWIIGNSTGAIIALALVYAKMSLREIRQLFYKMKDHVFGRRFLSITSCTKELTDVLQDTFGTMTMDEEKFPRVLIPAVWKKTTNLKLHFFSNHPEIDKLRKEKSDACQVTNGIGELDKDISKEMNGVDKETKVLVWKVARYTSAAPVFFDELDNYVDGGILANNPTASGLTTIQQVYRKMDQKLPISLVVSVGSGQMPEEELGRTDAHRFLFFGKHWFNFKDRFLPGVANLITLLGNAITESEYISANVRSRCVEQGIDYYRLSPHLHVDEIIGAGETDREKLVDMIISGRKCSVAREDVDELVLKFPCYSDANQKMSKRIKTIKS